MHKRRSFILSLVLVVLLISTDIAVLLAGEIRFQQAPLQQDETPSNEEPDGETSSSDVSREDGGQPLKGPIVVGSRDFTEQLLLGQLIAVALEDAGFEVIDQTGLGGTNSAHDAIKQGNVDIIWEYIGTILSESHGVPPIGLPTDLDTAFQMVSALDARHHNLLWLTPTTFNDTYTLMIRPDAISEKISQNLLSISDLAAYMNENDAPLTVCVENEFYSRGDGLFSLQNHYDFAFQEENIQIVGYDQLYEGLRDGLCDVAEGFSTDGRISAWQFENLEDTRSFFPAYNASPIVRMDVLNQYPEIGDILNRISPLLDNAIIAELNARIDIGQDGERGSGDEEEVAAVARDFLKSVGIIAQPEEPKSTVVVGSRDFTEQLLLGQILVVLLEDAGYEVIDKTGLGGTNSAHNALKEGEVDIIWDYIGTILSESHGVPPIGLPADTQTAFEMVRGLDDHHHQLVWLAPTAFNDTYTMMIKPESLEGKIDQSFISIEDLATYMNENDSPLTICVENEFYTRGDGLYSMQEHYGFSFKEENIQIVGYDQLYEGLRDDLCDVAEGFSTDGRISAWGFQNLVDSTLFFPAYNASPIVRRELLADHPEIADLLNKLGPALDNSTIAKLNARIDIGADGERSSGDEELVSDVARDFLQRNRLMTPPEIVVGSRDFTEQLLLGQILIGALDLSGFKAIDKTGLGGTNSAHNALIASEVDIIWDYIGTILSESHGVPPIGLPADTATALQMIKGLDAHHHNLIWLDPTAFNDTYTLMIKPEELAEKIDTTLTSIEDLAAYMSENESPLSICVENEFYTRGDGLYSLQDHYGFAFREEQIQIVGYDQLYEGLRDGLCDVAEGFSTDGRISAWGFQNLDDSTLFFPAYNASPIVRGEILDTYPEIAELFNQISPLLDNDTVAELNARIDIGVDGERNSGDEENVQDVAMSFLMSTALFDGLVTPQTSADEPGQTSELSVEDEEASEQVNSEEINVEPDEVGTLDEASDAVETVEAETNAGEASGAETDEESVDETTSDVPLQITEAITDTDTDASGTDGSGADSEPAVSENSDSESADPENSDSESADPESAVTGTIESESTESESADTQSIDPESAESDTAEPEIVDPETTDSEITDSEETASGTADSGSDDTEGASAQSVDSGSADSTATEPETAESQNSASGTVASGTAESEVIDTESTDIESTDIESTDIDSTDTESTDTESTDTESTDTEVTISENINSENSDPDSASEDLANADTEDVADGDVGSGTETQSRTAAAPPALLLKPEFAQSGLLTERDIIISSTNNMSQILLGKMLSILLQDLDISVIEVLGLGNSATVRDALLTKAVDIYTDLSASTLMEYHGLPRSAHPIEEDETIGLLSRLDQSQGIVWVAPFSMSSNYVVMVKETLAINGITTLDTLADFMNANGSPLSLCSPESFVREEPGLDAFSSTYEFSFKPQNIRPMNLDEVYEALRNEQCEVAIGIASEGRIGAWELVILEDEKGIFSSPPSAFIAHQRLLDDAPELEEYLSRFKEYITTEALQEMLARIELGADNTALTGDEESMDQVVTEFLCDNALLYSCALAAAERTFSQVIGLEIQASPVITVPLGYGVNARQTTSVEAPIVQVLDRGTTYSIVGRTEDNAWVQVQLADNEAWVFANAVFYSPTELAELPVVTPPPVEAETDGS